MDWSCCDENLLATGSNDTFVKVLDLRRASNLLGTSPAKVPAHLSPVVATLHKHQSKVHMVKFASFSSRYLASSGDSLIFWDLKQLESVKNIVHVN